MGLSLPYQSKFNPMGLIPSYRSKSSPVGLNIPSNQSKSNPMVLIPHYQSNSPLQTWRGALDIGSDRNDWMDSKSKWGSLSNRFPHKNGVIH